MPVFSHGYTLNNTATQFKAQKKATAQVDKQGSKPNNHAEQEVWRNLQGTGPYLLMQNAFPCFACHDFFIGLSKAGNNILIRVMADQGTYSKDHTNPPGVPCTIYYRGNAASYNAAPVGFPAIPALPPDYTMG